MLIKVKILQCLIANEVTGLGEDWITIITSILLALKNKSILIPHSQPLGTLRWPRERTLCQQSFQRPPVSLCIYQQHCSQEIGSVGIKLKYKSGVSRSIYVV